MPRPAPATLRTVTIIGSAVYLALVVWAILWKLDVPSIGAAALLDRPLTLVPFVASGGAGASDPLDVLANVMLFVPFGVYLGLLAPQWRVGRVALTAAGTSLALEVVQHLLSTGTFDTTDVITNTAGALLGLALLLTVRQAVGARADVVVSRASVAVTVVALVAVGAYVVSPPHVEQQHDVVAGAAGAA